DPYMRTASTVYHQFSPTGRRIDCDYDANLRKTAYRLGMGTADDDGGTYYAYDNEGNTLVVLDPRGNSTSTSYDERNRPYRVMDRAQKVTTLQYDTGGRKASVTRANGQVATF